MPNWCENILTIEGEKAEVERFILDNGDALATTEDGQLLSFEAELPTPQEKLDNGDDWYEWRVENWGTKWNPSDVQAWELTDCGGNRLSARCEFSSAWSPPIRWLSAVGANYPRLTIQLDYVEHGVGYCGVAVVDGGDLFDEERAYDPADYGIEPYDEGEGG